MCFFCVMVAFGTPCWALFYTVAGFLKDTANNFVKRLIAGEDGTDDVNRFSAASRVGSYLSQWTLEQSPLVLAMTDRPGLAKTMAWRMEHGV